MSLAVGLAETLEVDVRRKVVTIAAAGFISVAAFALASPSAFAGCQYEGENNALPTSGLPAGAAYANYSTTPSAVAGVGDGTSSNYAQVTLSGTTAQFEAASALAGESIWVDSNGNMGTC